MKSSKKKTRTKKSPDKPRRSFSKFGIILVFLLYAELMAFGQIAMWYFGDLSSLDSMWLYAVPPILALLGYFLKSAKENTAGGIVHDCALMQSSNPDESEDDTEPAPQEYSGGDTLCE